MSRLPILAVAFLSLSGASLASAQTISVRTLALRPGPLPETYIKGPKEYHALSFSDVQPNEAVSALSAKRLPLYERGTNAKGEETFTIVYKVNVPVGARGILLLGWIAGDEVRYTAIDDDFGAARFNDWLLINTGSRPVALVVGEGTKPVLIAPGTSMNHRISVPKEQGASILVKAPFNGKTTTFFSTYWPIHADRRTVVLFVDDGSRIRVKRISDKLAPDSPPAVGVMDR